MGYTGGTTLLVDGKAEAPSGPAAEWLTDRDHSTDRVVLVGGRAAMSDGIQASAQ